MYRRLPAAVLTAAALTAGAAPPTTSAAEQHLGPGVTWLVRALAVELVEHRGAVGRVAAVTGVGGITVGEPGGAAGPRRR